MSHHQTRSHNGNSVATKSQPSILRSRKRKISETLDQGQSRKRKISETIDQSHSHSDKNLQRFDSEMTHIHPLSDVMSCLNRPFTPDLEEPETWQKFRGLTCLPTPRSGRHTPLPQLSWADRGQLWELMCRKDHLYRRDANYLSQHSSLLPRMRAILLDWLTEVCEVYRLHRETYYLAVDYIDRYLTACIEVPKQQLQLVGISCLFVAAKIEEIYPPKLTEFAYVTDGACTENEILDKELVILKKISWDLTPVTSNCWLNTFLQLVQQMVSQQENRSLNEEHNFVYPQYSPLTFVQVARLLDLCTLDIVSLTFSSSQLATGALSYLISPAVACQVSGYSWQEVRDCYEWMNSFAVAVAEMEPAPLKSFAHISSDDLHNIQTHSVDMDVLERAQQRSIQMQSTISRCSPTVETPDFLTPPKSDEKTRYSY